MIGVALRGVAVAARNLFRSAALNLDFTKTQALDPRVTFSRASNATVTGPDGTLQYAPHNLLTYSEQFDNAAWTKNAVNVTANAIPAPDGSMTADLLLNNATDVTHYTLQTATGLVDNTSYTYSVSVKADTAGFVYLRFRDKSNTFFNFMVNLADGSIVSQTAGLVCGVIPQGDGWYRCYITRSAGTGANNPTVWLYSSIDGIDGGTTENVGIYAWGAQLNVGSLQPYYPTTVKNLLGFTQEFDNAAWTKSNSFVQTNQIRNNTMQGAVAGTPGALPTNWTLVAQPSGLTRTTSLSTVDGVSCIEINFSGTTTSSSSIQITPEGNVAAVNGQAWTNSAWVQVLVDDPALTSMSYETWLFDSSGTGFLSTGTANNFYASRTSFQRRVVAQTLANASVAFVRPYVRTNTIPSGVAVNITIRIGMPQLVQGLTAGDVVATYGTVRAVMYPAPDGSRTADKLVENTAASVIHFASQTPASFVAGTPYTASVYAKQADAGRLLQVVLPSGAFTSNLRATFDLSDGTVVRSGGTSAEIVSVGNGWYRCTFTATATVSASAAVAFALANTTAANIGAVTYTGDGTSGIYIWGAQLSDSASLDTYVYNPGAAPAAAAYYGPRFDYDPVTLAPRGLLIEEQRTNSIRNNTMQGAVAGTPGTAPTNWLNWTVASNGMTASIAAVGTEDGIPYIDWRYQGTFTGATGSALAPSFDGNTAIPATVGQAWSASLYLKLVAGSLENVTLNTRFSERASDGSLLTVADPTSIPVASGRLSASRFSASRTNTNASTAFIQLSLRVALAQSQTYDFTLRIGMPQLELGAFATSVIPTSGAAATRAADVAVMQGANFSNWYLQDEGTLFAESAFLAGGAAQSFTAQIAGDSSNYIAMYRDSSNQRLTGRIRSGAVDQAFMYATASSVIGGAQYKQALAYKVDDFATAANGASALTDTSGTVPTSMTTLGIGGAIYTSSVQLNGHIRKVAYFPRRLSNAELQGITS